MPSGERLLDEIATAVLDGASVDWAAVESHADASTRPLLSHLRLVSSVEQLHRSVLPERRPVAPAFHAVGAAPDRWGHLRLIERIGRGTFGEVFRAWETRLDREVALKLLPAGSASDSESDSAVIQEGRLLARVRHPNVVTIYGAAQIGDRIGLWMEFVRGQTLHQLLKERGPRSASDVVEIGVELCGAVSAVHGAGLLHRDIKAHNVMRADDGRIVLMDFGAGTEVSESGSSETAGTPLYLAPEVLAGSPTSVQSDVYSLGVLLFHLITGSYPVTGRSLREVRQGHERGERCRLDSLKKDVPSDVAAVVERACDPSVERRYKTADELARGLAALRRPSSVRVRNALAVAVAAVAAVLLLSETGARLMGGEPGVVSRVASWLSVSPPAIVAPTIVVRPLRNLGGPGSDVLVDTVTNGVIRQLGLIDGVQVKSQDTSFMLKDDARGSAEIGRQLGVNLVFEGSARFSGGRLLLDASLVSVTSGQPVWSAPFEGDISTEGDLAAVVEDLTRGIVDRLRVKLGRTQRRYETDLSTLALYRRAQELRQGRAFRASEAVKLYEEVIGSDSSYVPAWAALAATYGYLGVFYPDVNSTFIPPRQALALLQPLAQRALEHDEFLADAHAAAGFGHALALRWSDADAAFRRAIALESTRSTIYSDYVLAVLLPSGRLDEAIRLLEDALGKDPLSLDLRRVLTRVQLNAGRYRDALDNSTRILQVDPQFPMVQEFAAWARLFGGERIQAIRWFEQFATGNDKIAGTQDDRTGVIGYLHAFHNRRAEAEAVAALPEFVGIPQRRAEIYGLLGDTDRALGALRQLAAINPVRAGYELTVPPVGLHRDDPRARAFRRELLRLED